MLNSVIYLRALNNNTANFYVKKSAGVYVFFRIYATQIEFDKRCHFV